MRRNRAALMRMLYLDKIDILRWFIRSEWAGNWWCKSKLWRKCHLTCREGHNLCTKSMENWAHLWVTVWKVYYVKKKYDQPMFCLMANQVVLLQKTIIIWDGRNHLAVTLLICKRQPMYTAYKGFPICQSEPKEVHFCWVMEWWHLLGLIRSPLKSI